MLDTVLAFIEQHQLLPVTGEVVVAVSGGADSFCLLHILHRLCGPGKRYPEVHLRAAHLNHMLRDAVSKQDASTVTEIVTSWGLPLTIGEIDVPALAREERRSLEDAARVARYRFLREVAHGQRIAVAHHADDQIETLMLHWLRGGGLAGLVGMLPRQQDIIRPLLQVSHAETIAYCQQHTITFLEDESNYDLRFVRNRIRRELLPLLETINPGIRSTLLHNVESIRIDVKWIEAQIDAYWHSVVTLQHEDAITLRYSTFQVLPQSLQRHMVRRVTAKLCGGQSPLELRHYELIEQLFLQSTHDGKERTLNLPQQLQVRWSFNTVVFERHHLIRPKPLFSSSEVALQLSIPGSIEVAGTEWKAIAQMPPSELLQAAQEALRQNDWLEVWRLLPSTRHSVYVNGDVLGSFLEVRTRRHGDRVQPLGMKNEKKVQDVLVDKHIPSTERASVPLFFSTNHCVWIAGVCLDERVRLLSKTQRIVHLSIVKKQD